MNTFHTDKFEGFARHIFAPDPLSTLQHEKVHGVWAGSADDQAVSALMRAVLLDGIACFQGHFLKPSRTNGKLFHEAEEWINSNDDGLFSFNNVCETVGLDPERLRGGLERWKAKQLCSPVAERKRILLNKGKRTRKNNKAAYGQQRRFTKDNQLCRRRKVI